MDLPSRRMSRASSRAWKARYREARTDAQALGQIGGGQAQRFAGGNGQQVSGQLPLRAGLGHRAQPSGQEPDAPGEILEVVAAEEGLLPQQAV